MSQVLELTARVPFILRIDGIDHRIEYPVPAVAKREKTLGRNMRNLADWLKITAEELPIVIEAGLDKYAPERAKEIADAMCSTLPAEEIETVIEAICITTFPKATERYRKAVEELQQRAADALVSQAQRPSSEVEA